MLSRIVYRKRIDERNLKDRIYNKGQLKGQASRVCRASCWPRQGPSGPRTHCTGPVRTCSRPLGVQWSPLAPEIVGDCHDISVPPMKTTVSVECPTALYMAKPHALAGSACTQGETKVPHRGQPAAPRPQRPREWSAEVRRTCAELAMNLRESYGILLHLDITGDRDHVTPRSIGAGTSTLATSTPRPMHLRG